MEITLKGAPIHTIGVLPEVGTQAPVFTLTRSDLNDVQLQDYLGKKIVLNIFPSLDTPTCAKSVVKFNLEAVGLKDTVVLCISMDLPFAQSRFCEENRIKNVITLSAFRDREFGKNYGVTIVDGFLAQLLARSVIIVNQQGLITYTEMVQEITKEPNYEAALRALKAL